MRAALLASLTLAGLFASGACDGASTPVVAPSAATAVRSGPATAAPAAVNVVAAFSILGDLVHNVGRDRIRLVTLVGPDGDAHTFEPAPAAAKSLATATVIVANGLGFEPWLDDLYVASGSRAARVVLTDGIQPLRLAEARPRPATRAVAAPAGGITGEPDPHAWQDVTLVMRMVVRIGDALIGADPAGGEVYRANAATYLAELGSLDAWIREQVATLPPSRRKLVTAHDTLGYFARQYGFEVVGAGLGATTEAADPSAAQLVDIIAAIRAAEVPAIFAENVTNPRLMQRIASEAGVALVPDLYTDALGAAGTPGATYLRMMRFNVEQIVAALRAGG